MSGQLFTAGPTRELIVSLVVRDRGRELGADRFEATVENYPLLRELGRTPWEAVNRLVAGHRDLLERRWSEC